MRKDRKHDKAPKVTSIIWLSFYWNEKKTSSHNS